MSELVDMNGRPIKAHITNDTLKRAIDNGGRNRVVFNPPKFNAYRIPFGYLPHDDAADALFHYYLMARSTYERSIETIVLESDKDPTYDYRQLFKNVGFLHGVDPSRMVHHWSAVDLQCWKLNLPKLPENLRFSKIHNIVTK